MKKFFVYYDEINVVLPFHKIKVLEENNDEYRLIDLPITINCSLKEYQNRVGKIVYILHEKEDAAFIKNNQQYVNVLEDNHTIVKLYDKRNITPKKSKIENKVNDPDNRLFAFYKNSYYLEYIDEIYVLKQNDDGSVSIHNAPLFIKKSVLQYQIENDCFLVVAYRKNLGCNDEDIIELQSLGEDNKYDVIKIYDKKKVNVKKHKIDAKKEG